jgi:hypothetical protein
MQFQKWDLILIVGVGVMRPAYNFEQKDRVTMLNREKWTRGSGSLSAVKRAFLVYIWVQDAGNAEAGVYVQYSGR